MPHPYAEFESTPLWASIDQGLADLERNRDIALTTARTHVIGYMCRALTRMGVAARVSGHTVPVVLSEAEALVLFDLLARSGEAGALTVEHPAEEQVLWRLEGALERQFVAPFDAAYTERLAAAHAEVLGGESGLNPPAV
jgi:hypothetical protein